MRKFIPILLVVVMLTLALASTASAGGVQPPPLVTGFMLQNRSSANDATVVIDFYDANGVIKNSVPDTISKGGSKAYFVPNVQGLPDGLYSTVVSSSESLFALVNETPAAGSNRNVEDSHNGFSDTDTGTPLYLPWVVMGYYDYNSMFAVQNAGQVATDITVDFLQSGMTNVFKSKTFAGVKPGASVYLDMTTNEYKALLAGASGNGFFGGVRISSTGSTPLAAVLNDTDPNGAILRSYRAVKAGGARLYAAQVAATYYGYSSGLTFLNPGGADAVATVHLYPAGSTTQTTQFDVPVKANSTASVYLPNAAGVPANFNGSAVIDSTQPIMGVSTQSHTPAGPAVAYNLATDSDAATTMYIPQVSRHYYGFDTGYQIFNAGPGADDVTVTFYNTNGTVKTTLSQSIPEGSSWTNFLGDARGAGLGENFNGSATVTIAAGNTGKLVGIVNVQSPNGGDSKRTYTMFHD